MSKKKTKLLTYAGLSALAALFLLARIPFITHMKFASTDMMSLPVKIISFPFLELKKMLYYHAAYEQAQWLSKQNGKLKGDLVWMEELKRENARLDKLLKLKERSYQSIAANVIGRDLSNWNAAVLIDKGSRDGVGVGMPVVDASGIVGKVVEVVQNRAKIILISDPSFSIAATVSRSREVGLVSGTLTGQCRMRYLSSDADVRIGDDIVASKLSSSFPYGLLIGTVTEVESSPGSPFPTCLIKPAAPLSQIEEVIVIVRSSSPGG